jgi:hypothetical protein
VLTGDFLLPPEEEEVVATMAPSLTTVLPEDEERLLAVVTPDPRAFYVGLEAQAEAALEVLRPDPVPPGLTMAPTRVVFMPATK